MARMPERWRVQPGTKVKLDDIDPASTAGAPGGKDRTLAALPPLQEELAGLQDRLAAERRQSLLLVLQALDAGGKDGTIHHVFSGVNPQGVRVVSFKVPVGAELEHDFLWRVHRVTPAAGEIGIFNRSHYEDVLVVRVHSLVPESVWRPRYDQIVQFERMLTENGVAILKFFLHISREEQRERLLAFALRRQLEEAFLVVHPEHLVMVLAYLAELLLLQVQYLQHHLVPYQMDNLGQVLLALDLWLCQQMPHSLVVMRRQEVFH